MASAIQIIRRRRARKHRLQTKRRNRQLGLTALASIIVIFLVMPAGAALGGGAILYSDLVGTLPTPQETIYLDPIIGPTEIYDRTGETLLWAVSDPLGNERAWIPLDALPPYVAQATLLQEDPDFLRTARFDPFQTGQRLVFNYTNGNGPIAADPTLTGRLVRNIVAPAPEIATVDYRAREIALVAEINRQYTAEEVLEWHLNTNFYGNDAYGIDAAAHVYFGKSAVDLTLDEAALLTAIPTAPQYNPVDNAVAARGRQADTLRDLLLAGHISQEDFNNAAAITTPIQPEAGRTPERAPEYAFYARRQAESILEQAGYDGARMVSRGGLKITTALDLELHDQLSCTLDVHLARLNGSDGPNNCAGVNYLQPVPAVGGAAPDTGALTIINPTNGELWTMIGGSTEQTRQPGPALIPFVYFQGFSSSLFTPAKMVTDIPVRLPGAADGLVYTPANRDGSYRGPVNLRDAMGTWLLPPAVQVANVEGMESILRVARVIGLRGLSGASSDLSLLERGGGVSLLDVTYAYSVFAEMGEMHGVDAANSGRDERRRDPVAVLRIADADNNTLWAYEDAISEASVTSIFDPGLGYLVNDILADPSTRIGTLGAGNLFELSRPAAVVNGLAGDNTNAWTVGYSPNLVVGVWLGRADGAPMTIDPQAVTAAAPIWRAAMEFTHDRYGLPAESWPQPGNIVQTRVCERSGMRPNDVCPQYTEIFLENTQPPDVDTHWQRVEVNSQTGQLATANTPANLREQRNFFVPPTEAMEWWEANQLPLPPQEYDTVTRPDLIRTTVIVNPERLAYVSGLVDIRGNLDETNLQYYQLAYGQGLSPQEWIDITGQITAYTPGESLGQWDTSDLDGLYNLRLTAVLNDNSIDPYVTQVTVDNTPPVVVLEAGTPGQTFTFLNDDLIPLTALVEDNVTIDRVEFYHNGQLVGLDEEWPYGFEFEITRSAEEIFSAVAFDAAGNQSNTELIVNVGRGTE